MKGVDEESASELEFGDDGQDEVSHKEVRHTGPDIIVLGECEM